MSLIPFQGAIEKTIDLIREIVPDKDKQAELVVQVKGLELDAMKALLGNTTVPWVDAFVKLVYALVALAAPLGMAATTAFGLFMHYLVATGKVDPGVAPDTMTHLLIDSAFPAWRGARHLEKKAGVAIPSQPAPKKFVRSGPPR